MTNKMHRSMYMDVTFTFLEYFSNSWVWADWVVKTFIWQLCCSLSCSTSATRDCSILTLASSFRARQCFSCSRAYQWMMARERKHMMKCSKQIVRGMITKRAFFCKRIIGGKQLHWTISISTLLNKRQTLQERKKSPYGRPYPTNISFSSIYLYVALMSFLLFPKNFLNAQLWQNNLQFSMLIHCQFVTIIYPSSHPSPSFIF